jgi:tRNA 2-thiouridine synthesizing protein C
MSSAKRKKFLFVARRSPHAGIRARESLDMMLAAAAFEQRVEVLLLDDGVYQLKSAQKPEALASAPVAPLFEALEIYDVEGVWAETESLNERGLSPSDLAMPVRQLPRARVAGFLAEHDVLVEC